MKPFTLIIATLLCWSAAGLVCSDDAAKSDQRDAKPAIELTIDYGDGAQKRFSQVPWTQNMTVFDTLQWASKHPHGIEFKHRGKDSLALVSQIDDLKNSGGSGKNWIFYVNQKLSDRGCGASKVLPRDKILWRFELYR